MLSECRETERVPLGDVTKRKLRESNHEKGEASMASAA